MTRDATPDASGKPTTTSPPGSALVRRSAVVLVGVVAVAAAVRSLWMGVHEGHDLEIVLTSARAWRLGLDVYNPATFLAVWDALPGAGRRVFLEGQAASLYPPSTYAVLSPLTWLPLPAAKAVWTAVNAGALVWSAWSVSLWVERSRGGRRIRAAAAVLIGALLMYAVQTHFRFGQTALTSVALTLAALAAWERRVDGPDRPGQPAGVTRSRALVAVAWPMLAAGTALAIKPQLALPLLGYAVLQRRWIGPAGAAAVATGWLAVGWAWLAGHGQSVLPGLIDNVRHLAETDLSGAQLGKPYRYQLLNAHVVFHALTDNAAVVAAAVRVTVAVIGGWVAWQLWTRRDRIDRLSALSALASLSLAVTYHRSYDAVVLVPAVAWCLRELTRGGAHGRPAPRWPGWVGAVLLLCATSPVGSVGVAIEQRNAVPPGLAETWAWEAVVLTLPAYAVIALSAWFAWRTARPCSRA